jgi:adenosylhomocysteine nucleosidase
LSPAPILPIEDFLPREGARLSVVRQADGMTASESATRIAVLAPMRTEFRPLVEPLSLRRAADEDDPYHVGALGDVEIIATMTGIGTAAAIEVTERLLDDHVVDHVVVVGIAGGLGPELDVGDMVVPELVVDRPNDRTYRATALGGVVPFGTIVTSDEFNYPRPILDRFVADGVLALDMETGSVAAVCERRGVPWTAFRSLSDHVTTAPVETAVLGLARPDGSANVPALIRYLAPKPWRIRHLARLAKGSTTATRAAASAAVDACSAHEWKPPA